MVLAELLTVAFMVDLLKPRILIFTNNFLTVLIVGN